MNNEELEKLKELKAKQTLEKMKLKYEVMLKNYGFYFIGITNYNPRYVFLEYKNMKGNEKLLNSIVRIWKDLQTGKTEAEFIIDVPLEQEHRHWKHLSIKELLDILEEIEKSGKIPL